MIDDKKDDEKRPFLEEKITTSSKAEFSNVLHQSQPDPWGKGHKQLYLIAMLLYLNSTMSGFDGALLGNINATLEFEKYFGLDEPGMEEGFMFSSVQMGGIIGALFLFLADWKGRLWCIRFGSIGVIVAVFIQGTSTSITQFIFGRFMLGFFSTIACKGSTILLIEIAPPLYRGTVAGMYNTLYYFGSLMATTSVVVSQRHHPGTDLAWRLPIWYQCICPILVTTGIYFVPESPRWNMANSRESEAREFIVYYHANGDATHPIVVVEMAEMSESIRTSGRVNSFKSYFDFSSLLNSKGRRYRVFVLVCMSWFGQFSGNCIISYYLPQMVENVGITSKTTQLYLNGLYAIIGWIAAASGARLHDVYGRRKILLTSTCGLVLCLTVITVTSAAYVHTQSTVMSVVSIIWIYMFGIVFSMGYTSMQPIYPAEVMTNDMRAKGMALSSVTAGLAGFVNTFIAPIAMAKLGYLFYAFFIFWDMFEATIIHRYFVETKGRTLEDLDEVFNSPNPVLWSLIEKKERD